MAKDSDLIQVGALLITCIQLLLAITFMLILVKGKVNRRNIPLPT